jgi:hypothetical protein
MWLDGGTRRLQQEGVPPTNRLLNRDLHFPIGEADALIRGWCYPEGLADVSAEPRASGARTHHHPVIHVVLPEPCVRVRCRCRASGGDTAPAARLAVGLLHPIVRPVT